MTTHTHTTKSVSRPYPYTGPVAREEEPRAHGNVCEVETCSCGATRRVNQNRGYREEGPWVVAEAQVQGTR